VCHGRWTAYGMSLPSHTRGGSRMRESRPYGSVRGARDETHVPTATTPRVPPGRQEFKCSGRATATALIPTSRTTSAIRSRANVWPDMPLPPRPSHCLNCDPLVGYAARRRGPATGGIISLSIVLPPLKTAASELSDNQRSMLMRLSFRAISFSASKISGDCENDVSAS
jgi:hypothetical protein